MHKFIKQTIILFFLIIILILPYFVFAGESSEAPTTKSELQSLGQAAGYAYDVVNETSMSSIAGIVVATALSLLGVIFIILMIYAGYNWMTAGGNEEQVTKAKDTIKKALIGLAIVVAAYAIYAFVFGSIGSLVGTGCPPGEIMGNDGCGSGNQ